MSNYDNTVKEIIQEEIDVFQELENEELLAGLVLMQDEVVEQVAKLDGQKAELMELVDEVNEQTTQIRKQLANRNKLKRQNRNRFGSMDLRIS